MYILIFVDQETTEFAHNCTSHHFYTPLTQQQKFQTRLSRVLFLDIRRHCNRQSLRTPDIMYERFANGYKFLGYSLCCSKIVFGIIALCTVINFFQRVGGTCSLHLQGD